MTFHTLISLAPIPVLVAAFQSAVFTPDRFCFVCRKSAVLCVGSLVFRLELFGTLELCAGR
jgi:hypothetical protein